MKTEKRNSTTGRVSAKFAGKALLTAAAFALLGAGTVVNAGLADMFGGWVEIGNPGNANDTGGTQNGRVDYTYSIARYEVSINDYNSVMSSTAGTDLPKASLSLYAAMEFANALTTAEHGTSDYNVYSLETGGTNPDSSGYTGYSINYSRANAISEGRLVYAIPTEDEWYKAAYYDPDKGGSGGYWDYATEDTNLIDDGSGNYVPPDVTLADNTGWNYDGPNTDNQLGVWNVGGSKAEINATHDMMGNVYEWLEDADGLFRGGHWGALAGILGSSGRSTHLRADQTHVGIGVRIAAIPEPASGALLVLVGGLVWFLRRRVRGIKTVHGA